MRRATRPSRELRFAGQLVMIIAGVVLWPMQLAAKRSHALKDVVNAVRLGSLIAALAGRDPRALSAATAHALEPASSPLAFSARIFSRRRGSPWAPPDAPVRRAAGNRSDDAGASGSSYSSSTESGEQEGGDGGEQEGRGDGGKERGGDDEADGEGEEEFFIISGQEEAAGEEAASQFSAMPARFDAVASLLPTLPSLLTNFKQASPFDQRLLEEGEVVEGDYGRLGVWLRREGNGTNDTNGTEGSGTGTGNETNTGSEVVKSTVCEATKNWGWTCDNWLIAAAVAIVACCCCCWERFCSCFGLPGTCFFRFRRLFLLCYGPSWNPDLYEQDQEGKWVEIRARRAAVLIQKRARGMFVRRYQTAEWKHFVNFCKITLPHVYNRKPCCPLPAKRRTVILYLAHLQREGHVHEHSLQPYLWAINQAHEGFLGLPLPALDLEKILKALSGLEAQDQGEISAQEQDLYTAILGRPLSDSVSEDFVGDMHTPSAVTPVAGAATLEYADEESQEVNQAVTVRIVLNMHISESGEEGTYQRAKFKIRLLRELAKASGIQKRFLDVKLISAGSIIVDVDICPDPNADTDRHCPFYVATDLKKQAQDEQSQLRSGILMARLVSISIVAQCPSEGEQDILRRHPQEQQQVAPVIAIAAAEPHQGNFMRTCISSSSPDLSCFSSRHLSAKAVARSPSLLTNGRNARRRSQGSQSHMARGMTAEVVLQATETVPKGGRMVKTSSPARSDKDMSENGSGAVWTVVWSGEGKMLSAEAEKQRASFDFPESQEHHSPPERSARSVRSTPTNVFLGDRKPLRASDGRTPREPNLVVEEDTRPHLLGGVGSTNLFEKFFLTGGRL
jgi:hypothetical protein